MITRRTILQRLGASGGVAATASAMRAMGTFRVAFATPLPDTGAGFGTDKSVVVLGAGISGFVSAYELEQRGFAETVLEVRQRRVGGRAWTVRNGDKVEMIGEDTQTAKLSEGIYFNAGPARLPRLSPPYFGLCAPIRRAARGRDQFEPVGVCRCKQRRQIADAHRDQ